MLGADLLVCAICLPGRERRINEPTATDLIDLARSLAADIAPLIVRDSCFYGQCLGALVAFEVLFELERAGAVLPRRLYSASQIPPQYLTNISDKILPSADPAVFRQRIKEIGGLPAGFEDNARLWELIEPVLRADYRLMANYAAHYRPKRIPVPITALMGVTDTTPRERLMGWGICTNAAFDFQVVPGGHFLTRDTGQEFPGIIARRLEGS